MRREVIYLGDIKNLVSYISLIKLMLQLEYIVLGSLYFTSTIILSP